MGINFSRLLTLKYGNSISNYLNTKYSVVSVGRVMTCVLGMVVRREREIREFVETPFYRVLSTIGEKGATFEGEWRAVKGSKWFESFDLYKENGFKEKEKAEELIRYLSNSESDASQPLTCQIVSIEKKKEKKNPPLLFNLAEIQNECSKRFKISPDETLRIIQELYEKSSSPTKNGRRVLSNSSGKRESTRTKRSDAVRTGKAISSGYREIRQPQRTGEDEIRQRQTDHRPLCDHPDRTGHGSTKRTFRILSTECMM